MYKGDPSFGQMAYCSLTDKSMLFDSHLTELVGPLSEKRCRKYTSQKAIYSYTHFARWLLAGIRTHLEFEI